MRAIHRNAEERYMKIRKTVLTHVNKDLVEHADRGRQARLIEDLALIQSKKWAESAKWQVDWNWVDDFGAFRLRYPKRFEMALWHSGTLENLTIGRPVYTGERMRMEFIEACPSEPSDLEVFEISLFAIGVYAETMGAHELRIINPVNEEVRECYEGFGLTYVASGDYLYATL